MRGIHHSTEKAIEPAAMVTLRVYVVALLSGLSMYDRTGDHWLLV
jgi:hypothetical protein